MAGADTLCGELKLNGARKDEMAPRDSAGLFSDFPKGISGEAQYVGDVPPGTSMNVETAVALPSFDS